MPSTPDCLNVGMQEGLRSSMSANLKKLRPYDEPPKPHSPLVPASPDSAATLWLVVATLWLVVATGIGALWLLQAIVPQATFQMHAGLPFNLNLWIVLEPERMVSAFQNTLVFGWLTNAGIGAIWFVTPRVTGRPLVSNLGANVALGLWNLAVILGIASIYMGILPQTGPLSEFPLPIEALAALALLMVTGIFLASVARAIGRGTYVSVLFFGVALLAFLGLYTLNALMPFLNLADPWPELINGFYARTVSAYWLFGAAVGTLYYVVPRTTGNPLYSAGLGLLSWITWVVLAAISGLAALLDPEVPYAITTLGSVGGMLLVLPAFLVTANLVMTVRGRWSLLAGAGALSLAVMALSFLLMSSIIDGVGSLRSVGVHVAGTEWPVGALVYAGLGAYTFAFLALAEHAFPRLLRRAWSSGRVGDVTHWMLFAGVALAGALLMFGGLAHGSLLTQQAAPEAVDATMVWFRLGALAGMGLAALGALGVMFNVFMIYTTGRPADFVVSAPVAPPTASPAGAGS
jgi:cytochrome c oxidase cbb3-type subunit I